MIAVPIVTFWLVMMGLLLSSETGVNRLPAGGRSEGPLLSPTESWLGIFLTGGQRIGHVRLRQIPEARDDRAGLQMLLEARMRLKLLDKDTDLDLSGSVWRPYEEDRADFGFAVRSSGFDFEVTGGVADGELRAEMITAGETIPLHFPVDDSLFFSSGLGSVLRFPRLEVGDEYRFDSFDPLTLSKSEARVRCTAKETLLLDGAEVSTCRLTVTSGGLSSIAWIDDDGEVVRAETPIGLVLERLTARQARSPLESMANSAENLLAETAIRPTGKRPFRSARTMKVRLGGLEDLRLPEDRIQAALGSGRYLLSTPTEPNQAPSAHGQTQSLRGEQEAQSQPAEGQYLNPEAFVQSDHPKLRRQANAIAGDEEDPWQRALKIHDWVFTHLEKEPVVSIPSALEVLEQKRGDCNEHAVLFTALARAASVPTRIAIGIVWSDELEGFYYHAWPEIYLGDDSYGPSGWYAMDPTLGQPLADATHIKLLNGGIETWTRLLPYLGKLQIEILEIG